MTFHIKIPDSYLPEQQYIIRCIFEHFWGQCVVFHITDVTNTLIYTDRRDQEKYVEVNTTLFQVTQEKWLSDSSLPDLPLSLGKVSGSISDQVLSDTLPVIYGNLPESGEVITEKADGIKINIDIFGSAFFMLTRYEEAVIKQKDTIGRFPAEASLAVKAGFIDRPIINEYLEVLWVCIKQVWPESKRRERTFSIDVSHDVDAPFEYADFNLMQMAKRIIKSGISHGMSSALSEGKGWYRVKKMGVEQDPFNTFDIIMDISEKNNCNSAFYFITDHTNKNRDGHYNINQPSIKNILKKIYARGHEIGLHPSYNTFNDGIQLKKEFEALKNTCAGINIKQDQWGGRQHYLRWQTPQTFQHWADAGLNYDSTLTYASYPGFRCGICYPYPVFNLETQKKLPLIEKPLIIMEATVLDERYLGLSTDMEEAFNRIAMLKDRCKKFNGNFTILWHNNRFVDSEEIKLYQQILKY